MDETNKKMITQIKTTNDPIDNYPLIKSLHDFVQKKNENIYDFSNWLNFTLQILTTNQISFNDFLSKITFIEKDENLSTELFNKINILSKNSPNLKNLIQQNFLGPICFITPELGRWSTVGGLGVMVDELSQGLNDLGYEIIMISPYYDRNRKGESEYLKNDPFNIHYKRNIEVNLDKQYSFGIHYGEGNNGIKYYFIHNYEIFPRPYCDGTIEDNLRRVCLFCKSSLQLLCDINIVPEIILTNDWFTGLVPGYGKNNFGDTFKGTTFFHICHNLEPEYEGRFYPSNEQGNLNYIHQLNNDDLIDPYWHEIVINPSRCAILCSDQWGTVSHSYKQDLLNNSPLKEILNKKPNPFSFPNGVFKQKRLNLLKNKAGCDYNTAREYIQKKYFKYNSVNPNIPIFSFVGRITRQKGVHLILEVSEEIINKTNGQINILIGGMGNPNDPYFIDCKNKINYLKNKYPYSFWANPEEFFTDGPKINIGSDFGLMPSLFEPGGIVQHEFFLGGTPVIAYRTGGLKDTVFEFLWDNNLGNGLTFDNYNKDSLLNCFYRGINLFNNKDKYYKCRENAFNSVIDVKDVSKNWCKEFYRLRNKIFFRLKDVFNSDFRVNGYNNDIVNKVFIFNGNDLPFGTKSVEICGSYDQWNGRYPLFYDKDKNLWYVNLIVKKGKIFYKYIVNGQWIVNPKEQVDGDGFVQNNFVEV